MGTFKQLIINIILFQYELMTGKCECRVLVKHLKPGMTESFPDKTDKG